MSQYLRQRAQREQREAPAETEKQYETDEYMPGGERKERARAAVCRTQCPLWLGTETEKDRTLVPSGEGAAPPIQ